MKANKSLDLMGLMFFLYVNNVITDRQQKNHLREVAL